MSWFIPECPLQPPELLCGAIQRRLGSGVSRADLTLGGVVWSAEVHWTSGLEKFFSLSSASFLSLQTAGHTVSSSPPYLSVWLSCLGTSQLGTKTWARINLFSLKLWMSGILAQRWRRWLMMFHLNFFFFDVRVDSKQGKVRLGRLLSVMQLLHGWNSIWIQATEFVTMTVYSLSFIKPNAQEYD